ncbi:hypothetical protein [Rugosimonospora africana]|uniref:DNA-binding transcriptional activator of the SARP family n=1 Tax=Rugosimonospora africana TaxID=556532 RepID=A0A8J3R3Z4_9ACTN|nr:hypothetical protein [Rugosimonospora africana]GIH21374.1 hypothetical protein Raf01_95460 [Rugosimonospora africana]
MTGRWLRRLRAGLWLAILLATPPAALMRYIGWPLPHHLPARSQWLVFLDQPVTRDHVIDLFAIAVWLMWAALVYAVLVDLTTGIRRLTRRGPRLRLPPLPAALQATANGLLGAAVFGTGTAAAATPPHPPTPAAAPHWPTPPGTPAPGNAGNATHPGTQPSSIADAEQTLAVALPDGGGWLTHHTAAAIAASASVVWRQRRRHYLPRPLTGSTRHDPDLAPLPATVTAIQAQLQPPPDQPPEHTTQPAGTATITDTATDLVAVGYTRGHVLLPADLPAHGVGLTGPAAADAARGALIAALLPTTATGTHPRVITTTGCLRTLLGPASDDLADTPGLHVADELADALMLAENVALSRAARRVPTPTTPPPTPADTFPLLLIAPAPTDTATAHRLTMLLTLAAAQQITGLLLGQWRGRTWTVHPGGTITADGASPATRLSTLSPLAAADLLTICRQASQPTPTPAIPTQTHPPTPLARPQPPHAHVQAVMRLRALGEPALFAPGSQIPLQIPRSAGLPIMVLLALHRNGLTTGELGAALWPDLPTHTVARRIYTTVKTLRDAITPVADGPVVLHADERYRLNPQHLDVDLWQLDDAIEAATTAATTNEQITALREAIDHYHHDLAEGWPWPWLDPPRETIRRQVLDAHLTLADLAPDAGASLALLRAGLRIAPDNDELRRRVAALTPHDPAGRTG